MTEGARRTEHDPARPRLVPATNLPDNAPAMLKDIDARLAELYDNVWPELSGRNVAGKYSNLRERRSSRREAWVLVGRCLMRRLDRRTWRCGRPRFDAGDTIEAPAIADMMAETNLSRDRVKRSLRDWKEAGYLVSHRVVMEYVDGNGFCGLPSVRVATPLLMRRLRITKAKQESNRRQARAVWKAKRAPAASPTGMQKVRREIKRTIGGSKGYQAPPPAPPRPALEAGRDAQLARLAKLYGEPPEKP